MTWQELARKLADELTAAGALTPEWRATFEQVPRHVFVPGASLDEAYANDAVVTQRRDGVPTSSASAPNVVAIMLDRLNVQPGMSVLEIGTGTGYNAALLSQRLGGASVYSIDLDPALISSARKALELTGFAPTLRAGDGFGGMPDTGPFDRIIATCSINCVPPAWIQQLAPHGRIVAPFLDGAEGSLIVLDKTPTGEVLGRFDSHTFAFMPLRDRLDNPWRSDDTRDLPGGPMQHYGTTNVDPALVRDAPPELLLWLHLHLPKFWVGTIEHPEGPSMMVARPGAMADVAFQPSAECTWPVLQRGHSRLWDTVEHAISRWAALGKPGRDRLGITATDALDRQYVWLDDPDGPYSWPLPL